MLSRRAAISRRPFGDIKDATLRDVPARSDPGGFPPHQPLTRQLLLKEKPSPRGEGGRRPDEVVNAGFRCDNIEGATLAVARLGTSRTPSPTNISYAVPPLSRFAHNFPYGGKCPVGAIGGMEIPSVE